MKNRKVEGYIITNNNTKEDSRRMYLKEFEKGNFAFANVFDDNVKRFDKYEDVKYFINNILTFGYNVRIAKIQEEFKGDILIRRSFSNAKISLNTFNLSLDEITDDDVNELLFPEGKINFTLNELNYIMARRNYIKRQLIIKINMLIDFHNMLDKKFSFTTSEHKSEICDGNCPICSQIFEVAQKLDSPYLSKSLNNYSTAQKRFLNPDGTMTAWSDEELQVLLYDFNKLVANNSDMTIPEIAEKFYQVSKSPFYALIRRIRASENMEWLLVEMDKRQAAKKRKNK